MRRPFIQISTSSASWLGVVLLAIWLLQRPHAIDASDSGSSSSSTAAKRSNSTATYPHSSTYEAHAKEILDAAAARMQNIWNRKRDLFLSSAKGRGNTQINQATLKHDIENDYRTLVYDLAKNLSTIPVVQLKSPTLRRQVQRLSKLQLYGLEKSDYDEAKNMLHNMQSLLTGHLVCHIMHADDCNKMVALLPDIMNHMVRTRRYDELKYYWLQWRARIGVTDQAKSSFINYVRLLRIAATYNGHVTPSRTWYLYYETDNMQKEMEDVVWEIMPLYREMHAYLRNFARLTYGNHIIEADGALPAPIFEQALNQAWFQRTVFRTPYPRHQLPQVQHNLAEILLTPLDINSKAALFYETLGMKNLSSRFYGKFSRLINDDEFTGECKSEVYYFPPDVALRFCPQVDYKKLMQMHGHMAELHYNVYKMELPFGLDREPCPGFGSSIGETAVVASGTPKHLHRLGILANDSLSDEQSMNRLFRMGIHTILAIPQYFINDKFLADVMDGRIGANELNCGYWKLQSKFAGVVPPEVRTEHDFDPDMRFYKGLNPEKPSTEKFLDEVLGFQFLRALCLASGQYQPGVATAPMHNCDFYGSAKAGNIMKTMMKLGATQHWRDIMEMATGERKLSGRGVMEYFAPLLTWLKQQNKILQVKAGWDSDIKCRSN